MNVKIISKVEESKLKTDLPEIQIGDTLRLGLKVSDKKEGERIQNFDGILIRMSGSGLRKTLTVRKVGANGVGVEKIVPLHAPVLGSLTVLSKGHARRAKLYYLRDRVGKAATDLSR
jgi:large subunit ribosomal protein L19